MPHAAGATTKEWHKVGGCRIVRTLDTDSGNYRWTLCEPANANGFPTLSFFKNTNRKAGGSAAESPEYV